MTLRFERINGRITHYGWREGAAQRPIVFANSLGTDLRIWDDVIGALPPEIPILTYDKSGHGLSAPGAGSIAALADDLAALMGRLGIGGAMICGVSVGGMIAQSLAARWPARAGQLVLCNTSYRIGEAEIWEARIAQIREHGVESLADAAMERWFSPRFRAEQPDRVAGFRTMLAHTPAAGYIQVCEAIRDADLMAEAQAIPCPTLCIAGSDDQATPPAVVEALAQAVPGARYQCLDGVGHLPCVEAPEELAQLILSVYAPS